jgi:hypothetical protein
MGEHSPRFGDDQHEAYVAHTRPIMVDRFQRRHRASSLGGLNPRFETAVARARRFRLGAFIVLAILVGGCGGTASPASPSPASPSARSLTWTPIADLAPFSGGTVAAAIGFGPGLVAAGTVPEGNTVRAAAWTSTDGQIWTRSSDDPTFGASASFTALAASGSTLVGAGCVVGPESCLGTGTSLFWASRDGRGWTPSAITAASRNRERCCLYSALVPRPLGFVAVGTDFSPGPTVPVEDASVATTTDGRAWTILAPNPAFTGATMGGVAAISGGFVATGRAGAGVVVWTSTNGQTWTRATTSGLSTSADVRSLAAGGPGLVAVGEDSPRAASWTSKDGRVWQEAPDSPSLAAGLMLQVFSTSAGFIAIGTVNGAGAAWASPDGSTWSKLDPGPGFAGATITAVTGFGSRIVLFGRTESGQLVGAVGEP